MLGNLGTSRELGHADGSVGNDMLGHWTASIQKVDILHVHATVMKQTEELFHDNGAKLGRLQDGFVSHKEASHELQAGDLEGKVEGANNSHGTIWPTVSMRHMTIVITRNSKGLGQATDVVSSKVVQKGGSDFDLIVVRKYK